VTRAGRRMIDALTRVYAVRGVLYPAITVHGAGQWATARALHRTGALYLYPSGRAELPR
jgi:hypothetical protein